MLTVLGLIDVVMIANLLLMVIVGGYETFVSRLNLDTHPDQPEWLSHVNAGALKVKLATALVSISSIHLLKTFIEVRLPSIPYKNDDVMWQVIIHAIFVASAIALAWTDKLMMANARHAMKRFRVARSRCRPQAARSRTLRCREPRARCGKFGLATTTRNSKTPYASRLLKSAA